MTAEPKTLEAIADRATFTFVTLPEDSPVEECFACGDTDPETLEWEAIQNADVADRLEEGDQWAWCIIKMTATLPEGIKADDRFVVQKLPFGVGEDGSCEYRGKGGAKCAIGHEMSDEEFDRMKGGLMASFVTLPVWFQDKFEDREFCGRIQGAHDRSVRTGEDISVELTRLAERYELTC